MSDEFPDSVKQMFRAYDIRGVFQETLTPEIMERLGRAFAGEMEGQAVVVARDARLSGEALARAFMEGVSSAGRDVIYADILPLGVGLFHAWQKGHDFVLVTASHLPKEWNGLKFFRKSGIGFMEDELESVRENFFKGLPELAEDKGQVREADPNQILADYSEYLRERIVPDKKLRVAIDPGNGSACIAARRLFEDAGFEVTMINGDMDGNFPGRSPNPSNDPLRDLSRAVKDADFGMALDGDGDRLVIVDETGNKLSPEQMAYIILGDILEKEKGPIIANVEVTRTIDQIAREFNRQVYRIRVGHNYLVKWSWDKKASFGIERSGHFTAPWIFPFDDVLAIALFFGSVLSRRPEKLSRMVRKVPVLPFEQVNFEVPDEKKFIVMDSLREHLRKAHPNINTMDGVRVDMEEGWVLIRPSNTSPKIRLTIEARTRRDFEALKSEYSKLLEKYIKT